MAGKGFNIAYVRVSTVEQNEARQVEALKKYDIDRWYTEKVSAKDRNRPKLQEMLDYIREGDTVYIQDFSRLARSTKDLLDLLELMKNKGVKLVSDKENFDAGTANGKFMITVISAVNELERQNLLERQREGIAIAKREGKYRGGQVKKIDDALFNKRYEEYKSRKINKVQFAKALNISRPTLDRILKDKGLM